MLPANDFVCATAGANIVLGALARSTQEEAQELSQESTFETFRRWRPQLQIAVLLFFFAQFSGQANVLSFAPVRDPSTPQGFP
jgi:hypothetical protein